MTKRDSFAKVRADHETELTEDYLEALYELSVKHDPEFERRFSQGCAVQPRLRTRDLVEVFGVSQPTVTKTLDRLQRKGLIHRHPHSYVHLTEEGLALAKESHKRHRLVEAFLLKLGVPAGDAALDAEGIEHHLSYSTLAAMHQFLGLEKERS
jgi:DtxR family manganese transport transcriptional regulator